MPTTTASARPAAPWTSRCPSGAPTPSSPSALAWTGAQHDRGSRGCTSSIRTRRTSRRTRSTGGIRGSVCRRGGVDGLRARPRCFGSARDAAGRPTLVIVTGDHGESLGDHGELTHGLFAYESTLRVPLIISELGAKRGASTGAAKGSHDRYGRPSHRRRYPRSSRPSAHRQLRRCLAHRWWI